MNMAVPNTRAACLARLMILYFRISVLLPYNLVLVRQPQPSEFVLRFVSSLRLLRFRVPLPLMRLAVAGNRADSVLESMRCLDVHPAAGPQLPVAEQAFRP